MSRSRARLQVVMGRVERAAASAPQRWNRVHREGDGWLEAIHQLAGDGIFGGDFHSTSVSVSGPGGIVVRGLSAVPLRGAAPSLSLTRLRGSQGAKIIYRPGVLVPHASAASSHSLRVETQGGGCVLVAAVLAPGRVAMGEADAFQRLRLRTIARVDGCLALAEDTTVEPSLTPIDGVAGFGGAEALVSALALGGWAPATEAWWEGRLERPRVLAAAAALRLGGIAVRALAETLGDALSWLDEVESAARRV